MAMYRGSMLGAAIREVSETTKNLGQSTTQPASLPVKHTHQSVGWRSQPIADAGKPVVLSKLQSVCSQVQGSVWHLLAVGVYMQHLDTIT